MAGLDSALDDEGPLASINIIPFVDIVLVLLIIFMLTSNTIAKASLKVDLPKAASGGSKVNSTLNVVLSKQGDMLFNGEAVTSLAQLSERVRAAAQADAETQAVIAADKGVAYGKVMEIIDVVKVAGVKTFALDVERGAAPATTP